MSNPIPTYEVDIFSRESVRNARAVDDALREFAPVVRLAEGTVMIARHTDVTAGLLDWKTFSSRSRPWHDADSVRPEILLTDDPPRHTHVRGAMTKALSPALIEGMRGSFERDVAAIFDEVLSREGRHHRRGCRNHPTFRVQGASRRLRHARRRAREHVCIRQYGLGDPRSPERHVP